MAFSPPAEYWVLDGLEDSPSGRVARLERPDGRTSVLPLAELPRGVREGDVLELRSGPDGVSLRPAPDETTRRRAAAARRLETLNAQGEAEGGEITL